MQAWAEKLRKDGGPGVLLSLLLHLLLLLAALGGGLAWASAAVRW